MHHTKGPWITRETYSNGEPAGMAVENKALNIRLDMEESPLSDETVEAVKGLINRANAAPAMYEALRALVEVFPSVVKMTPYGVPMNISKIHDNAVAALAQAEGGTHE